MGAWCPKAKSTNQWLQIDLGEFTAVTKVATQGRYNSEDRVKTYTLSYSVDGTHWTGYKQRSVEKVFAGNTDRNTVITHSLKPHIEARYIRLHPKTYNHNVPCLRAELYGCRTVKTCLMPVGAEDGRLPDEAFTASSSASSGFLPNRGRLNLLPSGGKYCWAAAKNDGNQWLQVKLGSLYKIRGVATQGRHDVIQWVTSFSLAYTADDFNWVYIRENSQVKTFLGNSDKTTVVKHFFSPDTRVFARSVRFHPKTWARHILMRVEIYGCKEESKVNPKMEEYEHEKLDEMLQTFYTEIRTKDGFEYEPESLKSMLAALNRFLKEHGYKYSIIRDREFHQSKLVLERKVKCLRQQGKGKRPNAANALTTEEEEMLWSEQSLGDCSPRVLSQTMWWLLTQHFGLRGRKEHHSMEVEDFSFCVDNSGTEYVTFKENPTKTRQGGLNTKHRSVLPKMFATDGQRCPVKLLKQYLSRRQELREKGPQNKCLVQEVAPRRKQYRQHDEERCKEHTSGEKQEEID
ncbi:hypothetical protein ACROYT_G016145 [Oculina patagonica]